MNNYGSTSKQTSNKATTTKKFGETAELRETKQTESKLAEAKLADKEVAVQVIEEEMKVGKREVNRGGVRLSSKLVETPVETEVSLRDEQIHVERHAVDRPAEARDFDAFQGGTVEFIETDEEAVIQKQARVVEEVVVSKEVLQRTDKVKDTVRHTEVQIEPIQATGTSSIARFEQFDTDFRQDFQAGNYSKFGYQYDHVAPAYQYGYQLGTAENFKNRDWTTIEAEAGAAWEQRNPGTWEQMKNAARHAWEKVTGRR